MPTSERHIRVIVIDDNPDILMFAQSLLMLYMPPIVRVHISSHVDWKNVVPNWDEVAVAIVDLLMPTPGIEILRDIRDEYPHVKRIAWTAVKDTMGVQVEDEDLAVVITKPRHEDLKNLVLRMLRE